MLRLDQIVRRPLSAPLAAGWDHRYHQSLPDPTAPSEDSAGLCFLLPVGVHLTLTLPCSGELVNRLDPLAVRRWRRQLEILALLWCLDSLYGHPVEGLAGVVSSPHTLRQVMFWLAGHPLPVADMSPVSLETVRMWRQRLAPWMGPWCFPPELSAGCFPSAAQLGVEVETLTVFETSTGLAYTDRFPPVPVTLSEWAAFLEWLLALDGTGRRRLAGWLAAWYPLWRYHPEALGLLEKDVLETLGWFARLALDCRALWPAAALRLEMLLDLALFFEMSLLAEVLDVWSAEGEAFVGSEMTVFPPLTEVDMAGIAWREWLAGQAAGLSPVLIDRLLGGCPAEAFQVPLSDVHVFRLVSDTVMFPGQAGVVPAAARLVDTPPGAAWDLRQRLIGLGQCQMARIYEREALKTKTLQYG